MGLFLRFLALRVVARVVLDDIITKIITNKRFIKLIFHNRFPLKHPQPF